MLLLWGHWSQTLGMYGSKILLCLQRWSSYQKTLPLLLDFGSSRGLCLINKVQKFNSEGDNGGKTSIRWVHDLDIDDEDPISFSESALLVPALPALSIVIWIVKPKVTCFFTLIFVLFCFGFLFFFLQLFIFEVTFMLIWIYVLYL